MAEETVHFTKYEAARILGARALQLSMNAPMLLSIPKEKLEEVGYDPLKIAELEFNANVLPITVKRPLPERVEEEYESGEDSEVVEEIAPEEEAQKVPKKAESPISEESEAEEKEKVEESSESE
jgi:DNA-directed RNA polymerase subunit K